MRKSLALMLLCCVPISGCQTANVSNACAGWQKLEISKAETAVYLAKNDRPLANGIAGHNRHGHKQNCW